MRAGVVLGLVVTVLAATAAPPAGATEIGAHSQLHACCTTADMREQIFRAAEAGGARSIRLDIEMNGVFTIGPFGIVFRDWSKVDAIRALSRRHELPVTAVLIGSPDVAPGCMAGALRCPPAAPAAWAGQAAEVARRSGFRAFEVWNEPDGPAFAGTPQDYGALVAAAYPALKAAAPAATVVLGGTQDPGAGGRGWLGQALAVPGAANAFDVGSIHLRGPLERMTRRLAALAARLRAPVWVTEHGRAAGTDGEAAQAAYLRRSLPALAGAGAAEVYVTLLDAPPGPYESEGIVAGRAEAGQVLRPRAAHAVVRELTAQLARSRPARPGTGSGRPRRSG